MPLATRRPTRTVPARSSAPAKPASAKPDPGQPSPAAREPLHVLDIPFEARPLAAREGAAWNAAVKAYVYKGARLPSALHPYRSQPYSWERRQELELNDADPVEVRPERDIQLRDHQKACVAAIAAARAAGRTGFLVADDVGLGKTIETWESVRGMDDVGTVLIVCPLAVVPHWRRTIAWMGDAGKSIVVINYDRLKKLFDIPPEMAAKLAARKGKKRRKGAAKSLARNGDAQSFDLIIWDESHKLKNSESARSRMGMRLNAEADFVLWLSATAGTSPLELSYLARLIAESTGARARDLADFDKWCEAQGVGIIKGAYGKRTWRGMSPDPSERTGADDDLRLMNRMLFGGRVPGGIRRTPADIQGWPEINRILLPVPLAAEDRALYNEAWTEFRRQLELYGGRGRDSQNAMVQRLRFRQKASLLRTSATLDLALDLLEQGQQVAVSCAFRETLEVLREAFVKDGIEVREIHGEIPAALKERHRLDYQHGQAQVMLYTVEEGISLHQGEYNDAPRSNIIHDIRWSAIQMAQIEGRTHRDGRFSQAYWMMGEDTIEEGVAAVVARRIRSMSVMQGDDGTVEEIEKLLAGLVMPG